MLSSDLQTGPVKNSGCRGVRYFPDFLRSLSIKKGMWGFDMFFGLFFEVLRSQTFAPFFRESGVTTCNCMNTRQCMKAFYFFMISSKH